MVFKLELWQRENDHSWWKPSLSYKDIYTLLFWQPVITRLQLLFRSVYLELRGFSYWWSESWITLMVTHLLPSAVSVLACVKLLLLLDTHLKFFAIKAILDSEAFCTSRNLRQCGRDENTRDMIPDSHKHPYYFVSPFTAKLLMWSVHMFSAVHFLLILHPLLSEPTSPPEVFQEASQVAFRSKPRSVLSPPDLACSYNLKQVVFLYSFKHCIFWFCFILNCSSSQSAGSSSPFWLWKLEYFRTLQVLLCWNSVSVTSHSLLALNSICTLTVSKFIFLNLSLGLKTTYFHLGYPIDILNIMCPQLLTIPLCQT